MFVLLPLFQVWQCLVSRVNLVNLVEEWERHLVTGRCNCCLYHLQSTNIFEILQYDSAGLVSVFDRRDRRTPGWVSGSVHPWMDHQCLVPSLWWRRSSATRFKIIDHVGNWLVGPRSASPRSHSCNPEMDARVSAECLRRCHIQMPQHFFFSTCIIRPTACLDSWSLSRDLEFSQTLHKMWKKWQVSDFTDTLVQLLHSERRLIIRTSTVWLVLIWNGFYCGNLLSSPSDQHK